MKRSDQTISRKWIVAAIVLVIGLCGGNSYADQTQQNEAAPTPAVTEMLGQDAAEGSDEEQKDFCYVELPVPADNPESYLHERETVGEEVSEHYYMIRESGNLLLYSINFKKEKEGNWLGRLELDTGEVPVTYMVYPLADEELAIFSESERETYSALMTGFGKLLDSISKDDRFNPEKPLPVGEEQEAELAYWKVVLPGNISWTETETEDNYQAIFYGEVQGERVALYTVRIGSIEAQSVLGKYRTNDGEKTISVESYDLEQREGWAEDDYSTAYQLMGTINDVITAIMASDQFAAE